MPQAYGYVRWSSDQQESGDSLNRQMNFIKSWLKANGVQLDTSLGKNGFFIDEGKSAHIRDSLDGYELGEFIALVERGRIEGGSFFCFENLDRITRQGTDDAVFLLQKLMRLGIVCVQLMPEEIYKDRFTVLQLVMLGIVGEQSYQSSAKTRERVKRAWSQKKKDAKKGVYTGATIPSWLDYGDNCQPVENPSKVPVVKSIYSMAAQGLTLDCIAGKLNREGVKPFSERKNAPSKWAKDMVHTVLTNRAVLGEYQPHEGNWKHNDRKKDGEVIKNYYPQIITEEQFLAVQGEMKKRRKHGTGRGKHFNLFAGLLIDARDGGKFGYEHRKGQPPAILPTNKKRGTSELSWVKFNAEVLEEAILSELCEIKASDVLPGKDTNKVAVLSGKCEELEEGVKALAQQIATKPILAVRLGDILATQEAELRKAQEALSDAQREAASPLSEAFGQVKKLAVLAKTDEQRMRLRAALLRTIEKIEVLIVGEGKYCKTRVAVATVYFAGGAVRNYLILHQQGGNNCEADWSVKSFRFEEKNVTYRMNWQTMEEWVWAWWPYLVDCKGRFASVPLSDEVKENLLAWAKKHKGNVSELQSILE